MQPGQVIQESYGDFTSSWLADNLLVSYYAPSACLRAIHPRYDKDNPLRNIYVLISLKCHIYIIYKYLFPMGFELIFG
jgi:hypothetical protein